MGDKSPKNKKKQLRRIAAKKSEKDTNNLQLNTVPKPE